MAAEVLNLKGGRVSSHQGDQRPSRKEIRKQLQDLPNPQLDRRKQLLEQFGIKRPFEIDDRNSILTIDSGAGAAHVDTYATVPANSRHDGLFMKLTQTDWTSARVEGPGIESQMTVPPRTMAGAFGFWSALNGPMTLAGKTYEHSELDRTTGEVVLSDRTKDADGNMVLEQRRLRPSNGTVVSGDMLTSMPPKVGLVGFPEKFEPESALLTAATAKAKLTPGSTLHVSGKSIERLESDVTSTVRPSQGGWEDPNGAKVDIVTSLRVTNTDRAPIHHDTLVLRSGESGKRGYYDEDEKPTTIHLTQLPKANLNVGPGETQEILVEKQEGRAHVEYRIHDEVSSRPAGEGNMQNDVQADRFVVLDGSKGKRHAGSVKFFDGINEIGSAEVKGASPGSVPTSSDRRSSGVTASSKTTWSRPTGNGNERTQTVTKDIEISNISAIAGQVKATFELDGFSSHKSIKINGRELKDKLETPEFTARLESERWGGSKIHLTMKLGPGSEATPKTANLKIEVEGKFEVER
jgi:hypothetical protein